jgi:excisionase family DNA binding protein
MLNNSTNEFLTVEEAAKMLRLSKQTIYKWSEQGKIPCRKFGPKCLRFLFSDLEEFTRNQTRPVVAK